MFKSFITITAAIFLIDFYAAATDHIILSPDKTLQVTITIRDEKPPTYSLTYKGFPVLTNAPTGFQDNKPESVISTEKRSVNRQIPLLFAENDSYREIYNELNIRLTGNKALVFRMYNDGMAFRYVWNSPDPIIMEHEYTSFPLTNSILYQQDISDNPSEEWKTFNGNEVEYRKVESSAMHGTAEFPLLVESKNWSALINEAGNTGYSRGVLEKKDDALQVHLLGRNVLPAGNFQSPWRYVLLAGNSPQLINRSAMIYSLSPGRIFDNTSWIKPGKMMRCMQLKTDFARRTIDFCHDMHFQYMLVDAGWYGLGYGMSKEHNPASDALKPIEGFDIPAIVKYGKDKGVGVILYVNEVALRHQLPQMFPLYKQWGIAGLKFGFVKSRTQEGLQFVLAAVKQAADYGFIVDVHDDYRPTGLSRTFPNLLTEEGVRGAENMPNADHNTTLPFARFTTGAADYTIIYKGIRYHDSSLLSSAEKQDKIFNMSALPGHQLALSVIFFSPLQCIFWYGNSSDYDASSVDVEFFRDVPTVWDESTAICGETGKYITMARRNKEKWFVGSITNTSARTWTVPLHFLTKNKKYKATIFEDNGNGGIRKISREVFSSDTLEVSLAASGGQAVMLVPVE